MLDDDRHGVADVAPHLEAERPWVPASNVPIPGTSTVRSSGRRSTCVVTSSIVSPSRSPRMRTIGAHTMSSEKSSSISGSSSIGPPKPMTAHHVGLVVEGVVEQLLDAHLGDAGTDAADERREDVERPAGVDARHEHRRRRPSTPDR
ncbi:MAG: hypothetical protein R2699_11645 [Acidimicrobiales bacterium]